MGQHFGRLGAMANGRAPFDAKGGPENAGHRGSDGQTGLAFGTDRAGAPTKALPEIWTEQASSKEHSEKLEAETVKLAAAAKTTWTTSRPLFGAARHLQGLPRQFRCEVKQGWEMPCYVLSSMQRFDPLTKANFSEIGPLERAVVRVRAVCPPHSSGFCQQLLDQ